MSMNNRTGDRDPRGLQMIMFNWVRSSTTGVLEQVPVATMPLTQLADVASNNIETLAPIVWLGGVSEQPEDAVIAHARNQAERQRRETIALMPCTQHSFSAVEPARTKSVRPLLSTIEKESCSSCVFSSK